MGLLDRVEKRASIENPSTSLADPDAWLTEALGGGSTEAGIDVNHHNALKLSAVWACVNVLSQDVAKLPLQVYRRLERGKEPARDHPVYRVLHDRGNRQMSAYNLRRTLQAHVVTWGNAYAEIERNRADDVIGLWPLMPDRTKAHRIDGRKVIVTRVNNEDIALSADRVLHVPGLGFDGLRGYSVINMARRTIGGAVAADKFGAKFFGSGARPGGVIMAERQLSDAARRRLRDAWERKHKGLSNAQRVAVLDEGMQYQDIGVPPEDAQFLETRQWGVEDVARFFRVPPHKVQHLLRSTYSNIESQAREYVQDTLQAWLVNWEQELNQALFNDGERNQYFAEHNVEGLLRGNSEARSQFYQQAINNGWMTPNEVRERENLNPAHGGDQLFVPLNLMPLDAAADLMAMQAEGDDSATADDDDHHHQGQPPEPQVRVSREYRSALHRHRMQQAHARGFRAAAARLVSAEVRALRDIRERAYGERQAVDFLAMVERFYRGFEERAADQYRPVTTTYGTVIKDAIADELGADMQPDPQYQRFVADYTDGMATRHVRKSQDQLRALVQETPPEDQPAAIDERLDDWQDKRPDKIAQVESVRAMGAFSKTAYALGGVLALRWFAIGKSCPFCTRMHGRTVGVRELFASKGDVVEPEGDDDASPMRVRHSVGHPPLHSGCDCVVVPGSI